jgi:hypothetical protein
MLAGAGLFLFLGVLAQAATPPAVVNGAMVIARSVVAEGDLVVFHEYNLPTGWEDMDASPVTDDPWPLGSALTRLLNVGTSPVDVLQERPALVTHGPGLAAYYLAAGHDAPAWGSADLATVVLPNPTLFDAPLNPATVTADAGAYLATSWATPGDEVMVNVVADQTLLCGALKTLLQTMEDYTSPSPDVYAEDDLVASNGQLTDEGSEVVVAAFNAIAGILSECFTVGFTSSGRDVVLGNGVLDDNLISTITGSDFWTDRFEPLATAFNFGSASLLAVVFVVIIAIAFGVLTYTLSGNAGYAASMTAAMFYGGSFLAPWILQLALIVAALLWAIIGASIFGRLPR